MSDLNLGQSMSEAYRFISAGTAHTFTFNFQPDKVVFQNITNLTAATDDIITSSSWFRLQTTDGDSFQEKCIDAGGAAFNKTFETTNGFTVADSSGGVAAFRSLISAVTAADPCVITTTAVHGLQNNQVIRITDLGSDMPTARGMEQLNNNRYKITVVNTTSFSLQDPVSGEDIDSSAFTAWVSGGRINLESRVLALNNPQQGDYATTPYVPNAFSYDPIDYKLTAGTGVMGADSDVYLIEVYKWGAFYNLGDLVT